MKQILLPIILLVGSIYGYIEDSINPALSDETSLLPPPQNISYGTLSGQIDPCNLNFDINMSVKGSNHLQDLLAYYKPRLFPNISQNCNIKKRLLKAQVNTIKFIINNDITELMTKSLEDMDESYEIYVDQDLTQIQIKANQYVGYVRGLATLKQLIKPSKKNQGFYEVKFLPLIIKDAPRFPYRGFMLDTARHYHSVKTIKEIIDVLSSAKFSVFHWHIVDDESFPMELKSFPSITLNGAFSADKVYTREMMTDIINYGLKLGIRVIPEFDNPGHTRSIGYDPELEPLMRCWNTNFSYYLPDAYRIKGARTGVLDPSYSQSYEVIEGILRDINDIFPDNMLMLGGDEVLTYCFDENPKIKDFMKENGILTYSDLFQYHIEKVKKIVANINANKTTLYWSNEDTFFLDFKPNDILLYWGQSSNIGNLSQIYPNNKFVLLPGDHYYLDCGRANKYGGTTWCEPFKSWWSIYQFEPEDYLTKDRVYGGEVAAWSEKFNDLNIHSAIWPRALALADKLWGQKVPTDLQRLTTRLHLFEKQLESQGIPFTPITDGYCEASNICFERRDPLLQVANPIHENVDKYNFIK
ncbi:glycosyl hydrolase family catalytic domain containing protein [Stylonychia lemnae]|uniref:Beta-hexosaminidase n=1 Tax=Stylonychia lemnae TaxID=5949 RepID=A0A078A6W1_STYLE|nr:glycosyl hydrolase family catalytic domain containing protein [Stylonychia lemnae]|eukprot:CDW77979.1 glycosyl hydrolase family catalytic domain containing protein [Stylonychia lemnae]